MAVAALGALASAGGCVPTPFTFEEETGAGGSTSAGGGKGGESPASSGSGAGGVGVGGAGGESSSSSTGTGMDPCGAGQMCIEEVPAGWAAHAVLTVAPVGGPKPMCPLGEMPLKLNADPTGPHTCTPCGCGISNGVCSAPQITCWYQDAACNDVAGSVGWMASSAACITDQGSPLAEDLPGSCRITAASAVLNPGTCTTQGGAVENLELWNTDVRACAPVKGASCGAAAVCVPSPSAGQQICIRKDGDDECPAAWPYKVTGFADAVDGRDCADCGCQPITCVGGSYTVFDGVACDAATNNVVVNTVNCTSVPGILDGSTVSLAPVLGTIVQQGCFGGAPSGSITPTDPVTFCCKNQ